jgi:hypothetical protein
MLLNRKLLILAALGAALVVPASAHAGAGSTYGDYSQNGYIDACKYSSSQLQDALGSVPTDVAQYDPRFINQLNAALASRAGGACAGGAGAAAAAAAGKAGKRDASGSGDAPSPIDTKVDLPGDTNLSSDRGVTTPLAVLAGLVALIIAGTAGVAFWRGRGGRFSLFSDFYWGIRDTIGR